MELLILKTGALGDVLRTTSILPGLRAAQPDERVVWVTAPAAVDLVRTHPLVDEVLALDPKDAEAARALGAELEQRRWSRVLSFDDEEPLCALATQLGAPREAGGPVSGAYLRADGQRAYSTDVGAWFDMGLLSVHGKEEADRRKVLNQESHPAIYARMLGIAMGEPRLELPPESTAFAADFAERHQLHGAGAAIGLNTGAGGRWESKKLPVERVVELAAALTAADERPPTFLVLGGRDERERNDRILEGLAAAGVRAVDAGTDNSLLDFAALIDRLDLLLTSDSLALHMAVARHVRLVSFFAPTSAAEIELYGRGEKVVSTAPDYCSYKADADNSTITVERLLEAVQRVRREHGAQTR